MVTQSAARNVKLSLSQRNHFDLITAHLRCLRTGSYGAAREKKRETEDKAFVRFIIQPKIDKFFRVFLFFFFFFIWWSPIDDFRRNLVAKYISLAMATKLVTALLELCLTLLTQKRTGKRFE